MAGENDKSASQLLADKPANPLTGAEILVVTQDGESRGVPLSQIIAYLLSGDARIDWGNIIGTLDDQEDLASALGDKADTGHTHAIAQVDGLQLALNGLALTGHTHTTGQVDGLEGALSGKADTGHTHTMAQVSGLIVALAGKAGASHQHGASDIAAAVIDLLYPIGTGIYVSWDDTNPNTYLGRGTWEPIGDGSYIAAAGESTDAFGISTTFVAGDTVGNMGFVLDVDHLPQHNHAQTTSSSLGESMLHVSNTPASGDGFGTTVGASAVYLDREPVRTENTGVGAVKTYRPRATAFSFWLRTA